MILFCSLTFGQVTTKSYDKYGLITKTTTDEDLQLYHHIVYNIGHDAYYFYQGEEYEGSASKGCEIKSNTKEICHVYVMAGLRPFDFYFYRSTNTVKMVYSDGTYIIMSGSGINF